MGPRMVSPSSVTSAAIRVDILRKRVGALGKKAAAAVTKRRARRRDIIVGNIVMPRWLREPYVYQVRYEIRR